MPAKLEEKIKCPVCGMDVSKNSELKVNLEGETYYFCSEEDKTEFRAHPPKYLHWLERYWDGWLE